MAEPSPLLKSIGLRGFLSFGPSAKDSPLRALNVLIGPNGSGKSNLVEALSVLRAVPRDLTAPIREGGRVQDWFWRPDPSGDGVGSGTDDPRARIELVFTEGQIVPSHGQPVVRYRLVFGAQGESFAVLDKRLETEQAPRHQSKPDFYFGYPELDRLTERLARIRIYRRWHFGPDASVRTACHPGVRADHLSEKLDNLPARLAVLKRSPLVKRRLVQQLRELAPRFDDVEVVPEGGGLALYLTEGGLSFPARRLSDGTLHYLCLLTILVDPDPPPLIAIEKPELGLHPDVLPQLASLLVDASSRTQLVVTTHSDILVDALTDTPEAIVVCEKVGGSTELTRLDAETLKPWLDKYRLGELWVRGEIGGNRW